MSDYDPFADTSDLVCIGDRDIRLGYVARCLGIPADALADVLAQAERREMERAAQIAATFSTSQHIAHDMRTGTFPKASPIQEAIAAAIRAATGGGE